MRTALRLGAAAAFVLAVVGAGVSVLALVGVMKVLERLERAR